MLHIAQRPSTRYTRSETLEGFMIGLLQTLYYIPEYITEGEESSILQNLDSTRSRWTQVSGRRLQYYGGSVTPKGLVAAKLPAWLSALGTRMAHNTAIFGDQRSNTVGNDAPSVTAPPNHVLVNAYAPGAGIMAHEDGAAYFPGVCILSLGAPAIMQFHRKQPEGGMTEVEVAVALMPRSLLVFKDDAYSSCLHGIEAVREDVIDRLVANPEAAGLQPGDVLPRSGERVSLTFRRVPRVLTALRL